MTRLIPAPRTVPRLRRARGLAPRAASVLLVVLGCGLPALAQTITSFDPPQGTTGTQLTISGSGFGSETAGDKKPAAWLVPEQGKKLKLKVFSFQDDQVHTSLFQKKAPAGSYTVQVKLPGSGNQPVSAPDPFVVPLPQLEGTDKPVAFAGSAAEAWGDFLGTKAGKAWVGDRKAKVLSWAYTSGSPFKGGQPQDRVMVAVHPKLEAGVHDLRLRNGTGEVVLEDAFTVLNHGVKCKPGKPSMSARLEGDGVPAKLKAKGSGLVFWAADEFDPNEPFESTAQVEPAVEDLVGSVLARVFGHDAGPDEGVQTVATFVGAKVSVAKKTIKMVGLIVPDWKPEDGAFIEGAALALEPVVFYLESKVKLIGGEISIVSLRFWLGPATATDIVVNADFTAGATFAAEEMLLAEGDGLDGGPATIALTEAVLCNAYEESLEGL